ncbi:MAG: lipoprotein [Burkholderiaceae bacterium]
MAASLGGLLTLSACGQNGPLVLPKRPPKPPDAAVTAPADATPTDGSKSGATKKP